MSYTIDQQMVQRFSAAKSKKTAQIALLLNIPGVMALVSLCCFSGLVLYANFSDCDPLTDENSGVESSNQLLTHFVLKKFNEIPCILGLFMASIFCASLSSLSSALNSLSACLWRDFFSKLSFFKRNSEKHSLAITKCLVIVCGLVCTGMGFLISNLGTNLIQISSTINGALQAPIIGIFFLSCMFPFTNILGKCIFILIFRSILSFFFKNDLIDYDIKLKLHSNKSLECPQIKGKISLNSIKLLNKLKRCNKIAVVINEVGTH